MKITKICTNEIITCETTDNKYIYIKKYYTLDNVFKKEKQIDINKERLGNLFMSSTEKAFDYLIYNKGYSLIQEKNIDKKGERNMKKYQCIAKCPELDHKKEKHCIFTESFLNNKREYDQEVCPCGNIEKLELIENYEKSNDLQQ